MSIREPHIAQTRARLNLSTLWLLAKRTGLAWQTDHVPSMGAAISYYTVFSIAPLLVVVIAVAGALFDRSAAQRQIMLELSGLVGGAGAQTIQMLLMSVSGDNKSAIPAVVGVAGILIGATSVLAELQSALDRIWRVRVESRPLTIWRLLRTRVLSFGLILAVGFLLAVSLLLSAALNAVASWWGPLFAGWTTTLTMINAIVSFGVITLLFAIILKVLPSARISWRDVWVGAAVTAFLFEVGKELIGLYLGTSGVTSTFGAAGSLAVLLLWVYYSAQVFLLGAEFTWEFAHELGSRRNCADERGRLLAA